jgi:hypothetical protein
MEETQTEKLHNGDFMCKHQKLTILLIHGEIMLGIDICILFSSYTLSLCLSFVALLDERHRDRLVTVHDCLTCKEIDGRNSIDKKDDIWQCISDLFNDPLWVPISHIFSELQFCHEIALSLPNNADAMTPDKAKTIVENLWGKYKKAISGWRASGNGKEGKAENGKKIILLIRGTGYILDPSQEKSELEHPCWLTCSGQCRNCEDGSMIGQAVILLRWGKQVVHVESPTNELKYQRLVQS